MRFRFGCGRRENICFPQADAVVDPHRPDCEYPFKGLRGAVAYKLVEALCEVMLRDPEDVDYLMENVAICDGRRCNGSVGRENRIFVKQGLRC